MAVSAVICDEMVDPVIETRIEAELGIETYRAVASDTDTEVLELAQEHRAPILTRDRDFEKRHRSGENHHGLLYDPTMHHRTVTTVISALETVFDTMDADDIDGTVVRLKRFY
ncbi:MAG: DUF5615 family PIN-like protein [Candidatus Nanohaloarchaea archaeon]